MNISRRVFLKILAVIAAFIPVSYLALKRLSPVQNLYIKLTSPVMKESSTGSLDPQTLKTLLLATEALVETPIEKRHYEDFFLWRSENLRGYKNLHEQLVAYLDRSAKQSNKRNYADCDTATQKKILESIRSATSFDKLRMGILKDDWLLFEKYFFSEILLLFAMTDAWVSIGYETWPGKPRGLSKYTQPPLFLTTGKSEC